MMSSRFVSMSTILSCLVGTASGLAAAKHEAPRMEVQGPKLPKECAQKLTIADRFTILDSDMQDLNISLHVAKKRVELFHPSVEGLSELQGLTEKVIKDTKDFIQNADCAKEFIAWQINQGVDTADGQLEIDHPETDAIAWEDAHDQAMSDDDSVASATSVDEETVASLAQSSEEDGKPRHHKKTSKTVAKLKKYGLKRHKKVKHHLKKTHHAAKKSSLEQQRQETLSQIQQAENVTNVTTMQKDIITPGEANNEYLYMIAEMYDVAAALQMAKSADDQSGGLEDRGNLNSFMDEMSTVVKETKEVQDKAEALLKKITAAQGAAAAGAALIQKTEKKAAVPSSLMRREAA